MLPFVLLAGLMGCSPRSGTRAVEDSVTSGRIQVVSAPEALALIARERDAFQALYPQANIEVRAGSSREALRALFAAECELAVITRELTPEERAAAVRGGLELEGYRFARDALVMVVNPANPVQNVSLAELGGIYKGVLKSWSELAGPERNIRPVVQPMGADVTAFFLEKVMAGEPVTAPVLTAESDSAVVQLVSRDPDGLGYVTLAWAARGARPLRVSSLTGLPYQRPDAETVYRGTYPLTRFFNLYTRTGGKPLANGFITHVTSRSGQQIVQESGLVPTSVPVRFVRRSPLLPSH